MEAEGGEGDGRHEAEFQRDVEQRQGELPGMANAHSNYAEWVMLMQINYEAM